MALQTLSRTALGCLGLALLASGTGAPAASAPRQAEADARAICAAQAKRMKLRIPQGACTDPGSSFRAKMLTAHRELCEKERLHHQGVLKCNRSTMSDK